jgi:branched-chain amino acid transport system ATP-binding protein
MTALLEVKGLSKRFGGFIALNDVSLAVQPGERIGVLGPNGSGKSTLVNCITGNLRSDGGDVLLSGESLRGKPAHLRTRAGLARTFQIPKPFFSVSVLDNIRIPLDYCGHHKSHETTVAKEAMALLELVGLAHQAAQSTTALTQVELRKLELAKAIASNPKLLIADEALAGLSTTEVDEILELLLRLNERNIAIIMIEHIMRAVTKFSQRVIVLVAGNKIADGPTEQVLRDPNVERAYLGE